MERKMDVSAIDFDTLFEDISSEHADLLRSTLHESLKRFRVFTQNLRAGTNADLRLTSTVKSVGSSVMSFGHCPPPLKASLASFDDQVIKYLGDRGGPDEHLWTSLQDIDIPKQSQKQDTKYYNGQNRNMHRSISAEIDQNSQCIGQDYSQGAKPQDCSDGSKGVKNQPKSPRSPRYEESIVKVVSLGTETVSATSTQPESAVNALVDATVESTRSLALMYHADLLSALNTSTESSSTTVSTSADSINKLWDRIGQLVQTTSSDTATSSSSTTTSSSSIRLGKRGRYFLDIWDEEEFLSKIKTKTRLHVLQDWSELFHGHYTDNHDGCYRDWLVGKQMDTKARLLDNKFNKKKRPSDPIFWTNVVVPNDTSELAGLVPPPVPVAIQHPASWGIRKATGLDPQSSSSSSGSGSSKGKANSCSRKSVDIDASVVHPASCSQKAIVPVHGKQASSTDGAWSEEEEDVDDFNVYADRLDQQLAIEEASNFIRLSRLQNVLSMHESALKLGAKRRRLEDLVYRAIGKMEPSSSDRVLYAFKPLKSQSSASAQVFSRAGAGEEKPCGGVRKVDIKGNEIPRSLSDSSLASSGHQQTSNGRYNTRCGVTFSVTGVVDPTAAGTSTRLDPNAKFRRDMLGACASRQVHNGPALALCLQVGHEVEVLIDKMWQIGTICRLVCDGDHIRHVKIEPQDCICLQSVWVAVEDGKIAPVGTHLRLAKPAAASIKSAISFSSLPPSSPPPAAAWSTAAAAVPTSDVVPSGSLASTTAVKSSSAAGDGNRSMETASTGGRDPGKASAVQSLSTTKKSNSNGSRPATTEPPPPPPSSRQQHHEQPPQHHPQQHMYYPYPSPAASCGQLQNGFMPYQHHHQQQSHHGAINYAPAPTDYKPQQLHPAAHANGFHYHLPAPYAPALNGGGGAEATAATGAASAFTQIPAADPRMQKRQSPTTATPIATGDLSGIPVRNGVFPYSVGNISGVPNGRQQMVPDSNRVKIPLPMGATNARDLIPVNAYNNHHQMSPSSYLAQQHPPPPNLYGYNRSMQQHSLHPPSHPSLHSTLQLQPPAQRSQYEYEHGRSGMHTAAAEFSPPHHHISYDSVGFHTVDNAQHQQQPGQIAAVMPQQVISALNSVSNNSNHNNNNSSNSSTSKSGVPPLPAGTGAGTFRLGPRGSITRN